ncbi:hypothetical protein SBI_01923 [Streptomyces bingchenggensis BCW-1]|uniref:Uncharacterized protein n=1 Tax=Streptomyces bingchenggensis (strain BCW-1) TaxID=749414 RepID=D7BQ37_STRBB|nr:MULTISPECIES: hypothetical protein [Streptomyces]ADI05044.1 hypothetical protein SBI_01923 [Streptomyces bingchenggensis BCW-1]
MTAPHHVPGVLSLIGVDAGSANLREADHLIHDLLDHLALTPGTVACTHLIRTDERRGTAVSLALPDAATAEAVWERIAGWQSPGVGAALGERSYGAKQAARTAALAAAEHARRSGGRAVVYPGAERLTGTVTVADLLVLTAIDEVTVVGAPMADGQGPDPAMPVLTRDHVRPEWRDGRLTLALAPAAGGALAPFEVPNPTPCCADHA